MTEWNNSNCGKRRCEQATRGTTGSPRGARGRVAAARAHPEVYVVVEFGLALADAAGQLGISTSGIAKALARAEQPQVH